MNESRAICTYLITNYAKGKLKNLYPKDNLGQRTKIDQKLNYDKFHEALNDDYVGKKSVVQSLSISLFMSPPNLVTLMTEKMKVF